MGLTFSWDPDKAKANLEKHCISFEEASTVFGDSFSITIHDPDHSDDEPRFIIVTSFRSRVLVVSHAEEDERIVLLAGDVGFGVLNEYRERFPSQFYNVGVAEQNLAGVAAGLALSGHIVFTYTIANFPTIRCLEQIRNDICYHRADVKIVAVGGGMAYGALGPSHFATEDLAIMRAIPNMTVVAPADADEMRRLMRLTVEHKGPIYIRLAKGFDPIVTTDDVPFEIGKAIPMRQGSDALLVTTGITLKLALDAAALLAEKDIQVAVLHMPTIKPLDTDAIVKYAGCVPAILTLEEHTVIGGLGSAVAEVIAEANFSAPKRFKRIGIPDCFPDQYGSQASLMARYGLTAQAVECTVEQLLSVSQSSAV